MEKLRKWIQKEAVLVTAAVCALVSMFFCPPSAAYLGYIDLRVLCLLFCLMAVVAGLQECGLFLALAQKLLSGRRKFRLITLSLVLLPFFTSMLITNDVALITFVPFAILVLGLVGRTKDLIWVVVLQTAAANLGSMATPVGNPQNLFLYARYQLGAAQFFQVMGPLTLLCFLGLGIGALCVKNETLQVRFEQEHKIQNPRKLGLFLGLFILCLLSVFRVLPYGLLTGIVALCLLVWDRPLFKAVDYSLLATFVCFFIFAGNLGQLEAVRGFLAGLLEKNTLLTGALASQFISNVPAAVLLAGFTENWKGLLLGTNIGGLGTPIASLASLISLKAYLRHPEAQPGKYLLWFSAVNFGGLALLLGICML